MTRYNALFHWRVPPGREIDAGREVGRHHIITHAYWREGGPEFQDVNIMAVAHGTDKATVLAHKSAIDAHLAEVGIPVSYTNVFWGGRSEIKPSEISPFVYARWARAAGENGLGGEGQGPDGAAARSGTRGARTSRRQARKGLTPGPDRPLHSWGGEAQRAGPRQSALGV